MKKIKLMCYVGFAFLTACEVNRDISADQRLSSLVGAEVVTKKPMKLYKKIPNEIINDDCHYDLTTADLGRANIVGFIETGTEVFFDRAMLSRPSGYYWERLEGVIIYEKRSYSISYDIGFRSLPAGLRSLYENFELKN